VGADPLAIHLLQARYTTAVSARNTLEPPIGDGSISISRTTVSSEPNADLVEISDCMSFICRDVLAAGGHPISGAADASLFSVTVETSGRDYLAAASALAETVLEFRPVETGMASLEAFMGAWDEMWFTNGLIELIDLTAQQSLWQFGWTSQTFWEAPWVFLNTDGHPDVAMTATLSPILESDHTYSLRLFTSSGADTDSQGASIQISGLRTVPEPSSLILLVTGFLAQVVRRHRRRRQGHG
jgi:hypothetical protein